MRKRLSIASLFAFGAAAWWLALTSGVASRGAEQRDRPRPTDAPAPAVDRSATRVRAHAAPHEAALAVRDARPIRAHHPVAPPDVPPEVAAAVAAELRHIDPDFEEPPAEARAANRPASEPELEPQRVAAQPEPAPPADALPADALRQELVTAISEQATPIERTATGTFAERYRDWSAAREDPQQTDFALRLLQEQMTTAGVAPTQQHISCRGDVCRAVLSFADLGQLAQLEQVPREQYASLVFSGPQPMHEGSAIVLYWHAGAVAR